MQFLMKLRRSKKSQVISVYFSLCSQPRAFLYPINYYRNLVPRIMKRIPTGSIIKVRRKLPSYMPVLVVWGINDVFLEHRFAEQSGHFCNNYRFVIVSDATHWIQQEQPEKINRLIEDFINATPVSTPPHGRTVKTKPRSTVG